MTVPTYEMVETVCIIEPNQNFFASLTVKEKKKIKVKKTDDAPSSEVYFLTVGERGVVRIWCSDGYVVLL
jgi:U3 small nucleolar RNA-associated protein 13